jgi:uncharacterized protein YqjF (DUF2071 family)
MPGPRPFLTAPFVTAQWRNLVMLNYEVASDCLQPLVPEGTELDLWQGRSLISLVGFQFLDTRFHGWPIPFHRSFAEVNLRFYVRREAADGWRRGVVFIREIVPRVAISWVANTFYHEHYLTLPMTHRVQLPASAMDRTGRAIYGWQSRGRQFELAAEFSGLPHHPAAGSQEEFIIEHYWGYSRRADGSLAEYGVEHPPWRVWRTDRAWFSGDAALIYGQNFAAALRQPHVSALVAEGSRVAMISGSQGNRNGDADQSGSGWPLVSGASQITPRPTR